MGQVTFPFENGEEKFEIAKEKVRPYGFKLNSPIKTEGCQVLRPQHLNEILCCKDGFLLVGESAGFISLSSLEGISYAFDTALKLAHVFNEGKEDLYNRYQAITRLLRGNVRRGLKM